MNAPATILESVRVLDLSRLAPGPYGSMLLGDMGAEIIIVAGGRGSLPINAYGRGKSVVTLNLKSEEGRSAFHKLAATADVLIEGYRPGVADRLGIGYEDLRSINSRLIYCSVTGYGQDGPLAQEAGHDINYVGMSGMLGAMGPSDAAPVLPLNLVADFAGGGMHAALAIVSALYERERSGRGKYLDVAMVDGCISLMAMHYADWGKPVLPARGQGLLTGEAPFYRCHRCSDGRFVAVGALEPTFFGNLWQGLGLGGPPPDHMSRATWPEIAEEFERAFVARTRDEWAQHFAGKDACVRRSSVPRRYSTILTTRPDIPRPVRKVFRSSRGPHRLRGGAMRKPQRISQTVCWRGSGWAGKKLPPRQVARARGAKGSLGRRYVSEKSSRNPTEEKVHERPISEDYRSVLGAGNRSASCHRAAEPEDDYPLGRRALARARRPRICGPGS